MTKQKRLEASLYKGLRHMREVIYKALVVKDPGGLTGSYGRENSFEKVLDFYSLMIYYINKELI